MLCPLSTVRAGKQQSLGHAAASSNKSRGRLRIVWIKSRPNFTAQAPDQLADFMLARTVEKLLKFAVWGPVPCSEKARHGMGAFASRGATAAIMRISGAFPTWRSTEVAGEGGRVRRHLNSFRSIPRRKRLRAVRVSEQCKQRLRYRLVKAFRRGFDIVPSPQNCGGWGDEISCRADAGECLAFTSVKKITWKYNNLRRGHQSPWNKSRS